MSDKFTSVETPTGAFGLWGWVPPDDAVAELRRHYEREAATAQQVLACIASGDVRVFHQYGPYAMRDRRLVTSEDPPK